MTEALDLTFFFGVNPHVMKDAKSNAQFIFEKLIEAGVGNATAKCVIQKMWNDGRSQGYAECAYDEHCKRADELNKE